MTDNVTSLGAKRALATGDNRLWTPVDCLRDAIKDIESGERPANKLIVLRVNTNEINFDVGYSSANIRASEMLAAIECLKIQILQEMGF
jgi:hypothetical protein